MKRFKDYTEEIRESMSLSKKNCELCGKTVKRYQGNYDRPYIPFVARHVLRLHTDHHPRVGKR